MRERSIMFDWFKKKLEEPSGEIMENKKGIDIRQLAINKKFKKVDAICVKCASCKKEFMADKKLICQACDVADKK